MGDISVLPQLETTENIDTAMAYDALLSSRQEESARARGKDRWGRGFPDLLSTKPARFKVQAAAQCVTAPNVPPVKNLKTPKPDAKPDTKRAWLPKKEYLSKMAADKAAAADQAQPSTPNRGSKRSAGRKRSRPPLTPPPRAPPLKDTRQKIPEREVAAFPPRHISGGF